MLIEKLEQQLDHVVRLAVPNDGATVVEDQVYGKINFEHSTIDDQVQCTAGNLMSLVPTRTTC
jgi:glutamyl/glutaminyl-tRNA synthetase